MESSKYLIAGGTTNWVEGLAKFYAEDEKKRRDHGERLRQRDEAALKAMAAASPIKMLEKLSGLSQTVGKLVQTSKAAEAKKKARQLKEEDLRLGEVANTPEKKSILEQYLAKYNTNVKVVKENHKKLMDQLNLDPRFQNDNNKELKDLLISASPAQIIRFNEVLANQRVRNAPIRIRDHINGLKGDAQIAYDKIKNNPTEVYRYFKEFVRGDIAELGFNNEFIASNHYDAIEKIANTKGVLSKLDYARISHSKSEILKAESLKAEFAKNPQDKDSVAFGIQRLILDGVDETKGITHADSAQNVALLLSRLSQSGELPDHIIDTARQGLIKHDAGKEVRIETVIDEITGKEKLARVRYGKGDLLFSAEQWSLIQAGRDRFNQATVATHDANWARQGAEMRAKWINGDIDINEWNSFKSSAIRNGQGNKDWFKDLDDLGLLTQNPDTLQTLNEKWTTLKYQGFPNVDEASIKAIPDQGLSDNMLRAFKVQKAAEKKIGYEAGLYDSTISDTISVVPWADKATFASGDAQNIAIDVEGVRQAKVAQLIAANIQANNGVFVPDPTIKQTADDFAKDYWVRNGGGVAIQDGGTGRFSHSRSGDPKKAGTFPNWRPYNKYIKNKGYNHSEDITPTNAVTYYQSFEKRLRDGGFLEADGTINVEKMRNTAGAVFTIPQIVATFKEMKYSEEMRFTAARLQTPIHVLFEDALTAIKNVPTPKDGVNPYDQLGGLLGIDNKTNAEGIPLPAHVKADKVLLETLENATANLDNIQSSNNIRGILQHIKIYGWGAISNNNKLVIYKTLLDNVDENSLKELQELANNPLQSDYGLVPVLN